MNIGALFEISSAINQMVEQMRGALAPPYRKSASEEAHKVFATQLLERFPVPWFRIMIGAHDQGFFHTTALDKDQTVAQCAALSTEMLVW